MTDVEATLKERGTRYGEFETHAVIAQALKDAIGVHFKPNGFEPIHQEAIDMIFHKIARILNGDPNYADSWHDIAGYAILVEQYILKKQNEKNLS